jgi:uncharacterized membrane-anchored protein
MNQRSVVLVLFGVVVAIQIYTPLSMILHREKILKEGTPYKFKSAPVDPYDLFRGRYVQLSFAENNTPTRTDEEWGWGEKGFATIEPDPDGFAVFRKVTRDRPSEGDFLKVEVFGGQGEGEVNVAIPQNRYYMEESEALGAEIVYREARSQNQEVPAHAIIRVLDGEGVIEGLFIDGKSIEQILREPMETPAEGMSNP